MNKALIRLSDLLHQYGFQEIEKTDSTFTFRNGRYSVLLDFDRDIYVLYYPSHGRDLRVLRMIDGLWNIGSITESLERDRFPPSRDVCPICDRKEGSKMEEHHLTPKCKGGKFIVRIHPMCHSKIHATFSESELANEYYSPQRIRKHPLMKDFIDWIKDKEPDFYSKNNWSSSRRNKSRKR